MAKLHTELDAFKACLIDRLGPESAAELKAEEARTLAAAETGPQPPRVGEIAPDFVLPDLDGAPVRLQDVLRQGPAVLLFFRGGWCPFCTITLRAYQAIQPALTKLGASLIAIAPQRPEEQRDMAEIHGLRMRLLVDHDNATARAWNLAYELPPTIRKLYQRLGHPIPERNGTDAWEMPFPATFVLRGDGRVMRAHYDPRISKRMEPADALATVRAMTTNGAGHAAPSGSVVVGAPASAAV
jgi:peroxiredoxin